jgi:translation initiation factor IF-2
VAGPQNIPKPAQLSGPRVIRMDKPEVIDRPRPAQRPSMRPPMRPPLGPPRGLPPTEEENRRDRHGRLKTTKGSTADTAADKRPSTRKALRDEAEDVAEKLKEWRDRDLIERRDRLAHASGRGIGGLRAIEDRAPSKRGAPAPRQPTIKKSQVELSEPILIKDFSRETGIAVASIIKKLMEEQGQLATVNTVLETEMATNLAMEQGIELVVVKAKTGTDKLAEEFAAIERKHVQTRPPVVTVLGHVDHGKTTLLDRIRKANVAAGEAGGITQHIGAYRVKVDNKWVAFLDTPGHTAFTAMRARGTVVTDVVVLVVAADDGVMPTTIEAINHAKAAGTPIVVALNKIDLPHDINKIYGQLTEQGLTPSGDWGGDTDVVPVSALKGEGVEELLSHLATLSEVMELKADATIPATGTVVEAQRSDALGNVARVLVQEGTLKAGDVIVCGAAYGRVRALKDEHGKTIKTAGPSTPVEVTGLSDVPEAGDKFYVVESSQRAKEISEEAAALKREQALRVAKPANLESMLANAKEGEIPELRVIVKADMQGSVDVLKQSLTEFPSDQVKLSMIHAGVGAVTESDVLLAQASSAIIVAFHVVADPMIQRQADGLGVDIRSYKVIYNLIDDVKKALEGLLTPDEKLESRGRAEVRDVFSITRVGKVAGCFIKDGVIQRSNKVRLIRDGVPIKDLAALESLRRFKDDVKEVKAGFECGIRIAGFDDVKPGDIIEAFEMVKVPRKLGE